MPSGFCAMVTAPSPKSTWGNQTDDVPDHEMNEKWKPDDSTPVNSVPVMPAAMAALGRRIPHSTTVASQVSPVTVV